MTTTPPVPAVAPARTALVSGAGRGIGRHLAIGLAEAGLGVGLVGRTLDTLEDTAEACREHGVPASVAVADVTVADDVDAAVDRIFADLGSVDLLVNNAGAIENLEVPFADDDVEDVWRVVEVNIRGPLLITHAVLPQMLAAGGGRIIGLSSGAAYRRSASHTGYGISKGGLARLSTILDAQYRDRGIRTFDLSPGVVRTDMSTGMPMHHDRTEWTDPRSVVDLLAGIARGHLDAVSGRFMRAGVDTVEALSQAATHITATDARRLQVTSWGDDDPLADPIG